jgi:uncharacterized membrane-anchored protein YhcB (DUF1043 family)
VKLMNQYEQMQRKLGVAAKRLELEERTKRKFNHLRKSAEDWRVEAKEEHDEAREALLNDRFPMLEGCMETL